MLRVNQLSGFGGKKPSRFLFESVENGAVATVEEGTTRQGGEKLAYLGIGHFSNSAGVSLTGFTWDGVASDW